MTRLAFSTISLPPGDQTGLYGTARSLGFSGVEVAPSRLWHETWHGLLPAQVTEYRRAVEANGLAVVGLHSLFFDQPALGLFRDQATEAATLDFLVHLSAVCRDLGGRSLIFGSPAARRRRDLPQAEAALVAVDFFQRLCRRIEGHGTCFCLEPLGPAESDFANSVAECLDIVNRVGHPSMRMQIDAKALTAAGEVDEAVVAAAAPLLVHVHANQPDLGVLADDGTVDHARIGALLRGIGYDGFATAEQRMVNGDDPLADLARSAEILQRFYA